MKLVWFSANRV